MRPLKQGEILGGIVSGDASDVATFSYSLQGQLFCSQNRLTDSEKEASSGYRELLNIEKSINENEGLLKSEKEIKIYYWMTDSKNVFYWFKSGSTRVHVQELLVKIYRKMFSMKIRIIPQWVPRSVPELVIADLGLLPGYSYIHYRFFLGKIWPNIGLY